MKVRSSGGFQATAVPRSPGYREPHWSCVCLTPARWQWLSCGNGCLLCLALRILSWRMHRARQRSVHVGWRPAKGPFLGCKPWLSCHSRWLSNACMTLTTLATVTDGGPRADVCRGTGVLSTEEKSHKGQLPPTREEGLLLSSLGSEDALPVAEPSKPLPPLPATWQHLSTCLGVARAG